MQWSQRFGVTVARFTLITVSGSTVIIFNWPNYYNITTINALLSVQAWSVKCSYQLQWPQTALEDPDDPLVGGTFKAIAGAMWPAEYFTDQALNSCNFLNNDIEYYGHLNILTADHDTVFYVKR